MHGLNKKCTTLLIVAMVICQYSYSSAEYQSIKDVYLETRNGWHTSYEAHGRTITIDCDIEVPKVEEMPILLISRDENRSIDINTCNPITYAGSTVYLDTNYPNEMPEHSTLKQSEAWSILADALKANSLEIENFNVLGPISTSCIHKFDEETKSVGECINEKGCYMYTGYQLLQNIPLLCPWNYDHGNERGLVYPYFRAYIYDADTYSIAIDDAIQVNEVLLGDVPLLSFSDIQKEYEKLIYAGMLRDVFQIRLAYFPFVSENDPFHLVAIPMWNIIGDYKENATSESGKWETQEDIIIREKNLVLGWGTSAPPIFAQSGEIIDLSSTASNRNTAPTIVSWDELREQEGGLH